MKNDNILSKKEIRGIFKEFKIKKKNNIPSIEINKYEPCEKKNDSVWIITDSTSQFNNFNIKKYGKLERVIE